MFGSRANKFLILAIVVICISGLIINGINRETPVGSSIILGGNSLSLAVLRVEEILVLSVVKNAPASGEFFIGEVNIAVSPVIPIVNEGEAQAEPEVFAHRVLFRPIESETFNLSLPFGGDDFIVVFSAGDDQRSMRLRVVDVD
jgi:hypothetical protein